MLLKLQKLVAVPKLLYWCDGWTSMRRREGSIVRAEITFLKSCRIYILM